MASTALQAGVPLVDASTPLRGVVLCCTNIEPDTRTALAKHAEEMGAVHRYDLTSEVTHLITGHYETPKYRYVAKERPDVKVLSQEWIEAVRQLWINDQPIDLAELEKKHTRPALATLKICMTGFEDPLRTKIIETVKENGGEYSGNLTKTITHLIAKTPEGTKYKFAKQWGLQLVTQEWLFDTVERGMILEEKLYHPEMPAEQRGKGAWARHRAATPLKRDREDSGADTGTRKIRRTLSTKLQSQNEVVWGDIVGSGASVQPADPIAKQSRIANTNASSTLRSLSNVSGMDGTADPENWEHKTQGIFSNCRFYIHGFGIKRAETMRQHLVSHDAQVCATADLLQMPHTGKNFIVVPHSIPNSRLPPVPANVPVVTEWWVERCLEVKLCLEPTASKFDLPFPYLKIQGLEGMVVSSTGFNGYQLLHLSKVVTLMGAKYDEFFTKNSSVLVCNMQRQIRVEKLERAKEWRVPAVDLQWLLDSITNGKKEVYKPYIVRMRKESAQKSATQKSSLVNIPFKGDMFDGFDVSMEQAPTAEQEHSVNEFKRPLMPATRDDTAFDKDYDEDGDLETLNDLLKKHKKPVAEPNNVVDTGASDTALEPPAGDILAKPAEEPEPESLPPITEAASIQTPLSSRKATSQSPSKSKTSPTKPHTSTENTSPRKPSPKTRLAPLLDTEETMQTITSLLTKPRSKPFTTSDPNQNPRRILGRAPSNIHHSSGEKVDRSFSRNSSLAEQTAKRPTGGGFERTASMGSVVDQLLAQEGEGDESQKEPTQTQRVSYFDEDAEAEKEQALARMMGKKLEKKPKERGRTISSLGGGRGVRVSRRIKEGEDEMGTRRGTGR